MKAIGIVLIVVGLVGLLWGGITWTDRETVLDLGSIEVTTEDRDRLPFPPVAGGICVAAGAALLIAGSRRRPA
jgi:hypothetical protein